MEPVGRYRIVRRIAQGGMAEIFDAVAAGRGGFERRVVLKRMLSDHEADASFARMFLDEARIAGRLHHGNIVAVLDYGELDGRPFQVLERVDGLDGARLVRRARECGVELPVEIALHVCAEVARGLAHAHSAVDVEGAPLGIVHRDVTPANVLISWDGEVKLSDFGIATAHDREEVTRAGITKGKLAYMAPEQATGGAVDGRTDVFALGCSLHRLLTGRSPLAGDSTLMEFLGGRDLPIDEKLDDDVRAVIERAVRRDRGERHSGAVELAQELEAAVRARVSGDPRARLRDFMGLLRAEAPSAPSAGALFSLELIAGVSGEDVRRFERTETQPSATPSIPAPPTAATVAAKQVPPSEQARSRRLWPAALAGATLLAVVAWGVLEGSASPPTSAAASSTDGETSTPVPTGAVAGTDEPPQPVVVPAAGAETPPAQPLAPGPSAPESADATTLGDARRQGTGPSRRRRVRQVEAASEAMSTTQAEAPRGVLLVGGAGAHRALIRVDGVAQGYAPRRLELSMGRHEVALVGANGEAVARRSVELTERHTRGSPLRFMVTGEVP